MTPLPDLFSFCSAIGMEMVLAQKLAELGNARSPAVGGGGGKECKMLR